MDNNQIISDWRGECRHKLDPDYHNSFTGVGRCLLCTDDIEAIVSLESHGTDIIPVETQMYTTDPAAWDENLYAEIEEKKLNNMFVSFLNESMPGTCPSVHQTLSTKMLAWHYTKATPTQKACALARTIQETE